MRCAVLLKLDRGDFSITREVRASPHCSCWTGVCVVPAAKLAAPATKLPREITQDVEVYNQFLVVSSPSRFQFKKFNFPQSIARINIVVLWLRKIIETSDCLLARA